MSTLPPPVIVLPGILGSYLRDTYPVSPQNVWQVLESGRDYSRVLLHPDDDARGFTLEANQPVRIEPDQLVETIYRDLVEELRHELTGDRRRPVPVYPMPYDWRLPLDFAVARLAAFVDEVIARTSLTRHYVEDGYAKAPKVALVGHSMGGLVIAGYLASARSRGKVAKVATIATPYQGSLEAVVKLTTGTDNLGASPPAPREREAARLSPGVYHLLPSFAGAASAGEQPIDLFAASNWQSSLIDTIAQYVRDYGIRHTLPDDPDRAPPETQAGAVLGILLDQAAQFRRKVARLKLSRAGLSEDDYLCIVGVGVKTRVQVGMRITPRGPAFVFDEDKDWKNAGTATGDATVPFQGALPPFLPPERLVALRHDDFGFFELKDKAVSHVAGFHAALPTMNMLHRLIARFIAGRPDAHGSTWGRVPPGVAPEAWRPPLVGGLNPPG